jgi:hypothetical protein
MSNVTSITLAGRVNLWLYRLRTTPARYRRALLYARGRLTPDAAQSILLD